MSTTIKDFTFPSNTGICTIHARDKDAVVASMLICEMAAYYKLKGKSLIDVMNDIYKEFGMCLNKVKSFEFEGASGMEKMAQIMDQLRNNPPKSIAGLDVLTIADYEKREKKDCKTGSHEKIDLPKSNVISFKMEDGNGAIVRPSGTEPKIKLYMTAMAPKMEEAEIIIADILSDMEEYMK